MMSFLRYLFIFLLLSIVIASPQMNLYFTDSVSNRPTDHSFEHTCLYITTVIDKKSNSQQMISFCLSESSREWNIQANSVNQIFTFAELHHQNITSEQLYRWSTPIDIIERYQFYLIEFSTSMSKELFYNCTFPYFGVKCEYQLDFSRSEYSSLIEMIDDFYLEHPYKATTLTCYFHLKCNRGSSSSCLDWSEICDGKIDCLENGIDEEHCWKLEINQCDQTEYRCSNGQCIPFDFFRDNPILPDCLDGSDEIEDQLEYKSDCSVTIPSIACEDVTCTIHRPAKYHFYKTLLTSSCHKERNNHLAQALFPNRSKFVSGDCWLAFKCIIHMPISQEATCWELCQNKACDNMIMNNCPEIFFVPELPVLFDRIYFAYSKNHSRYSDRVDPPPYYVCFKENFCAELLKNKNWIFINQTKCLRPYEVFLIFSTSRVGQSWLEKYISPTSNLFLKCNSILSNQFIDCNQSNIYQCLNSTKCISINRLNDGIYDCVYFDDENEKISSTKLVSTHFQCLKTNKSISYRLVKNGECDCNMKDTDDACEDENSKIDFIRNHISFQTICDGFVELNSIIINGENHTDESECQQWICNNRYTHCDQIWNCFDGLDEINCSSFSLLDCSSSDHPCVSIRTGDVQCLPIKKANDGRIDCLGGTDEPKFCRSETEEQRLENFYCTINNRSSCILYQDLCNGYANCDDNDDEFVCDIHRNWTAYNGICFEKYQSIRTDIEQFLCQRLDNERKKQGIVYFSLDMTRNSINQTSEQEKDLILFNSKMMTSTLSSSSNCHRGLDIRVWMNREGNLSKLTCLCPSSYFGDQCQYQTRRISLTIQIRTLSDSWRTPFVLIVYLIDKTFERRIHSYQQWIYLSMKDCQRKFQFYLAYSNMLENSFIHIDIYEQFSFTYRASFLFPIQFPFLPVYRLALQLTIPRNQKTVDRCSEHRCIHGKCIKYSDNDKNETFCQCESGWSGESCTIPYHCTCSIDSLCLGISASTHRSICLCPRNKFGSRCLLTHSIQPNTSCFNGGEDLIRNDEKLSCICRKGFHGDRCELIDNEMLISFSTDIILSPSVFLHFIQVMKDSSPRRSTTFKTLSTYQTSLILHWSYPFHLLFIEFSDQRFYFVLRQTIYNESARISKRIESSDRCQHLNEIFNQSIVQFDLIRRIKYYHLPCRRSWNLSCFYDDIHLCLCEDFLGERQANCLEFDHGMKLDCLGQSECENNARCFQDNSTCPQTSICICSECFYGRRCQFSTNGFTLSLDAILGYHIQPSIPLVHQPTIVQFSLAMTIILTIAGLINSGLLMITFRNEKLLEVGSGIYLLVSSVFALLTTIMFALKFSILLAAQMESIANQSFLYFQCIAIDFLLRIGLQMDYWLNACVGCERAMTAIKATRFNKRQSKKTAKYLILILLIVMIITSIHDPVHRRLIDDGDEYGENKRIWCVVSYSSHFQIINTIVSIIHFCVPFFLNLISTIIIIRSAVRQRIAVQPQQTQRHHVQNQLQRHSRILIAPFLLVILSFPRLIISFTSDCLKSVENSWLFILGYFVSFIPLIVTSLLFVLPSKLYKQELIKSLKRYQIRLQQFFFFS